MQSGPALSVFLLAGSVLGLPQGVTSTQGGGLLGPAGIQLVAPDPSERLVGIPIGFDATAVASAVGAVVEGVFGAGNLPLSPGGPGQVALLQWTDAQAARTGSAVLLASGRALFVELNAYARQIESSGCDGTGAASVQQCTAAFVDNTPTSGEYSGQSPLSAIALDQLPPPGAAGPSRVAIIDTGIDPTHPALAGRLAGPGFDFLSGTSGGWDRRNGQDDDGDGLVDEAYGHGTHVAGIVAVVDPSARLLSYRVLDADGNGTAFDVALAILRAAEDGADCINLSLGLALPSKSVEEAVENAAEDDDDLVIVTSAGNKASESLDFLARLGETVAVAAVDDAGVLAPFASYGEDVDVVAPGVGVYSALPGGRYAWWSGSSMSSAIFSGAFSRLLSTVPGSEADDVLEALLTTAVPVGAQNPGLGGLLGSGMIHVADALDEL